MQSDMCAYTHILTIYRGWSGKRNKKFGTAVNAALQRIFLHVIGSSAILWTIDVN